MIDHPSYRADTGCTSHDVEKAIRESAMSGGTRVAMRFSDGAACALAEACDWENEGTYAYRGTVDYGDGEGERRWSVYLEGP